MKTQLFSLLFVTVALIACKSESAQEKAIRDAQEEVVKSMNEAQQAVQGTQAGNGEVVAFQVLKDALPESLAGLKRTSHTGQKTSMMSFNISNATAEYEDGDRSIRATITDTGGMGIAMAGLAAWTNIEMDSESDAGYERTTIIDGRKAFEKYTKSNEATELSIIQDNRFIITLNGRNISMDDMHKAAKAIEVKV